MTRRLRRLEPLDPEAVHQIASEEKRTRRLRVIHPAGVFSSALRTGDDAVRFTRILGVLLFVLTLSAYLDPNDMGRLPVAPITRIRSGDHGHGPEHVISAIDSTALHVRSMYIQ
jgi:hypothetical protein